MSVVSTVSRRLRLDGVRSSGASLVPLWVLFGLNAVDELDQAAFNVLTPEIRDTFGLSNMAATTIAVLLAPVVIAVSLPVGFLADRSSRKRLAIGGACVWMIFGVGVGLATTVVTLYACRALGAVGRSVNGPTHRSLLSDFYPPDDRIGVFSAWRLANPLSHFIAPVLAGLLGAALGFRVTFMLLAIPTGVMVIVASRLLQDPVRGAHERRAQGADEQTALIEEPPPSWQEAWRIMGSVTTVRRIRRALPFLVGGVTGIAVLRAPYYEEVFGVGAFGRGLLAASNEPFQILGLVLGIPYATRIVRDAPDKLMRLFAYAALAAAAGFVGVALAPNVYFAGAATCFVAMSIAMVTPGIPALFSLIVPPRVRTFGFGVNDLFALPGLVFPIIAAYIADRAGFRVGMLAMVPILLIGAYLVGTAGGAVRADIRASQMAALAAAEYRRAREMGRAKLLVCRGVDVHYGDLQVLFDVSFDVDDGEIVALLGTNGAGKSTLLKAIAGVASATGGSVVFDGRDVTYMGPQHLLAEGICYMPGGRSVFPGLSVTEHLELACWHRHEDSLDAPGVDEVLARFPALAPRLDQPAGNLSGGEQQMLGLSMALLAQPRLLMIDELSLGLAPTVVATLLDTVRDIHAAGTTVVIVEQSVNLALGLAKRAVFMEKGEIRFEGPSADLLERTDLLRSVYLEGAAAALQPVGTQPKARFNGSNGHVPDLPRTGPSLLVGTDLSLSFGGVRAINGASIAVSRGEIVGLIGPNGAGKTTLLDVLSGFRRPDSGSITLDGQDITGLRPDQRVNCGLGRSFQDARLFPSMTVEEAIAVAHHRHLLQRGAVAAMLSVPDQRVEERVLELRVAEIIEVLGLGAHRDKFISELSTGTRRVVDLGCALAVRPSVLLLDEPSSGIAQRESEALGPVLRAVREETGMALVVIEHDMPLVLSIADRLIALDLGAVVTEGEPAEVLAHPHVVSAYLGDDRAAVARSGPI